MAAVTTGRKTRCATPPDGSPAANDPTRALAHPCIETEADQAFTPTTTSGSTGVGAAEPARVTLRAQDTANSWYLHPREARDTETETLRETEKKTEAQRQRDRKDWERQRQGNTETERETEAERQRGEGRERWGGAATRRQEGREGRKEGSGLRRLKDLRDTSQLQCMGLIWMLIQANKSLKTTARQLEKSEYWQIPHCLH